MDDCPFEGAIADPSGDRPCKGMTGLVSHWFEQFHGWDYIYADVARGKPNWRTAQSNSLLRPITLYERWKREDHLIGVRFATKRKGETHYLLLDIDRNSQYHPYNNEPELKRLLGVLESIGLCRCIPLRSSASEGVHLYFPLSEAVVCTGLAVAVRRILEQQDFTVEPGQLEIFPNVRTSSKTLYQGHRLPLQIDSYVLDDNWQPLHNSLEQLVQVWFAIAALQDTEQLKQTVAKNQRIRVKETSRLEEWRKEGEELLQNGWTRHGQTNDHLRTLCLYARVFIGLDWQVVEGWVFQQLRSIPGYQRYCRHKREIKRKICDWIKLLESEKKYFPAGSKHKKKEKKAPTNEKKAELALHKIKAAIAELKQELGTLPATVRQRQSLICKRAKCSPTTLYKYKELWHPDFDGKGSVTPCSARASSNSKGLKEDVRVCSWSVTPDSAKVSAQSQDSLENHRLPVTQINQAVTDPLLLSVYSQVGGQNSKSSIDASNTIKVGDTVKCAKYNAEFQVKRLNTDGTVWARRKHYPVPLVDVILSVNEIELIKSQYTVQLSRRAS